MVQNKSEIRKIYQNKRKNLDKNFVIKNSSLICKNFINNFLSKDGLLYDFLSKNIAIYYPVNNEVKLDLLIDFLQKNNCDYYLPKIDTGFNLNFGIYNNQNMIFNSNYPKILEPKEVSDTKMDIIICPLVVFDKNCNRIGVGGGYYDRLIEKYQIENNKVIFIGLAYGIQYYKDILQIEEFDKKLDFIIDENEIYPEI
jgi:5-formyltetrahydrofolate cyclo-ligase